jgi:uncharacterized membrane protein YdjX (TVP38/TMEM64 family)
MRWALIGLLLLVLILVPFFLFEDYFNALGAHVAQGHGSRWYAALGVIALLGSDVVLPIPSSLVSAASGVLLGFGPGAAAIWIGMSLSCAIGYGIGARSAGLAKRFVGEQGLARAKGVADRYGDLTIVLCRPVPVLAEATTVLAGLVRAPFSRFAWQCGLSNAGVALGYAAIGAFSMRADSFLLAFLGSLALPGMAFLFAHLFLKSRPSGDRES